MKVLTNNFENGVPFDPGYSHISAAFSAHIDAIYNILNSVRVPHQKKFQFKMYQKEIIRLINSTMAFYLGCLLWAAYISNKYDISNPKEIADNGYLGKTLSYEEMYYEINYLIEYLPKFEKDCKYYIGKPYFDENWLNIAETYKEFLKINECLIHAEKTSDIKLPSNIKKLDNNTLEKAAQYIEKAVNDEMSILFQAKELIF